MVFKLYNIFNKLLIFKDKLWFKAVSYSFFLIDSCRGDKSVNTNGTRDFAAVEENWWQWELNRDPTERVPSLVLKQGVPGLQLSHSYIPWLVVCSSSALRPWTKQQLLLNNYNPKTLLELRAYLPNQGVVVFCIKSTRTTYST